MSDIADLLDEMDDQKTREAILARDADLLECMVQGKELFDQGHKSAKEWFEKPAKYLKSKTARHFYRSMLKWNSLKWWDNLKKLER